MRCRSAFAILLSLTGCAGAGAGRAPDAQPAKSRAVAMDGSCRPSVPTGAGLEVVVLGSGGPVPGRRACASHAVLIDGIARVLVDAGPGAAVRLGESELDTQALDIVLLTHLHVD